MWNPPRPRDVDDTEWQVVTAAARCMRCGRAWVSIAAVTGWCRSVAARAEGLDVGRWLDPRGTRHEATYSPTGMTALTDTKSGWTSEPVSVNLAGYVGDAVMIDPFVIVVAGAPVSSSGVVPVVARLALDDLVQSSPQATAQLALPRRESKPC
jgi:hypothetical protein